MQHAKKLSSWGEYTLCKLWGGITKQLELQLARAVSSRAVLHAELHHSSSA
jgi:hypothetical protein